MKANLFISCIRFLLVCSAGFWSLSCNAQKKENSGFAQAKPSEAHRTWQKVLTAGIGLDKSPNQFVSVLLDSVPIPEAFSEGNDEPPQISKLIEACAGVEPLYSSSGKTIAQAIAMTPPSGTPEPDKAQPPVKEGPTMAQGDLGKAQANLAAAQKKLQMSTSASAAVKQALEAHVALLEQNVKMQEALHPSAKKPADETQHASTAAPKVDALWHLRQPVAKWAQSGGWVTITIPWSETRQDGKSFANRMQVADGEMSWSPPFGKSVFTTMSFDLKLIDIDWATLSPSNIALLTPPAGKKWIGSGSLQEGEDINGALPALPSQLLIIRNLKFEQFDPGVLNKVLSAIRKGDSVRHGPVSLAGVSPDLLPAFYDNLMHCPQMRVVGIKYTLIPRP